MEDTKNIPKIPVAQPQDKVSIGRGVEGGRTSTEAQGLPEAFSSDKSPEVPADVEPYLRRVDQGPISSQLPNTSNPAPIVSTDQFEIPTTGPKILQAAALAKMQAKIGSIKFGKTWMSAEIAKELLRALFNLNNKPQPEGV